MITEKDFIKVEITAEMLEQARQLLVNNAFENNRSLIKKNSLFEGFLGEVVFETIFPDAKRINNFDYDFLWNKYKTEIKTRTVINGNYPPLLTYNLTIQDYNLKQQNCDIYVCIYLNKQYSLGWIVGTIAKEKFKQKAVLNKKGSTDERNGFIYFSDKWLLELQYLNKIYC